VTFSALIVIDTKSYSAPFKKGIGLFSLLKLSKPVFEHPSTFKAEDKERIELFLYTLRVLS
jgi:hypothetical protein